MEQEKKKGSEKHLEFVGGSTVVNTAAASASGEAMARSIRASVSLGSKWPRDNRVEGL